MIFPHHEASLHLTHNDHKSVYKTVQQAIDDEDHGYTADCWVNEEQRLKAIETDDCWSLQWYPDTPVGFCMLSAADLDALLVASLGGADASFAQDLDAFICRFSALDRKRLGSLIMRLTGGTANPAVFEAIIDRILAERVKSDG